MIWLFRISETLSPVVFREKLPVYKIFFVVTHWGKSKGKCLMSLKIEKIFTAKKRKHRTDMYEKT